MTRDPDPKADPKTESKTLRLLDKRTVDRNIKKGLITRKDYDKHLKALDDVGDKGVYGGPAEEPDDDEDDIVDDEPDETEGSSGGNSHS